MDQYQTLKKNRKRVGSSQTQAKIFHDSFNELFDVGASDAMAQITNEEDRAFYAMQREDVMACSMSGLDLVTAGREHRKRLRDEQENVRRTKARAEATSFSESAAQLSSMSSSDPETETDEDFSPIPSCSNTSPPPPTPHRNIFASPAIVSALDRAKVSDRGAVFVAGTVAQALGHDVSNLTLSRSSIRRSRRQTRFQAATRDQEEFTPKGPLLLHWDSKILPDYTGDGGAVDRVAILVTGSGDLEKLLAAPKVERGTGKAQAAACMTALDDWSLRPNIQGLVFDTTASNTGLHRGACTLIEEGLGRELVWIACRHHIYEISLSSVFREVFGSTEGPETAIFKRFKAEWPTINKDVYSAAPGEMFEDGQLEELRTDMIHYLQQAMKEQQVRADYAELLSLSLLLLNGEGHKTKFRPPGPTHHARWMGKGLYVLKIFLFRKQFRLTAKEARAVKSLSLFVALIYVRFWNEAPRGVQAPRNDLSFLQALQEYPNKPVAAAAITAFTRHMWYLAEHLVGLAFFDEKVDVVTKGKMVANLERGEKSGCPRRLKEVPETGIGLDEFVTKRTLKLFSAITEHGTEKAKSSFLKDAPDTWEKNQTFQEMKKSAKSLNVVNDAAERAVSLVESYNASLTKDEEQKQYILRIVADHRRRLPFPVKGGLMKSVSC